jgi:hypothetical protein
MEAGNTSPLLLAKKSGWESVIGPPKLEDVFVIAVAGARLGVVLGVA